MSPQRCPLQQRQHATESLIARENASNDGLPPAGVWSPPDEIAVSSSPRPNSLGDDSRVATVGSWDRGACRSWGRPGSDSIAFRDDRTSRKRRSWYRSCMAPGTSGSVRSLRLPDSCQSWPWPLLRFLHHHRARAFLSLIGLKNFFAQPQAFGRYFDKFVIGDELNGLFEIQ